MGAQRQEHLPDDFRNELARLVRAGFPLLPLGGGDDGKAPLLRAWAGPRLPLARILAPLYRSGSQVYGIRLDGLAVVDCDDDSAELVAAIEARFGASPDLSQGTQDSDQHGREKGGRGRLIGRTKGGMNTKLHAICDVSGGHAPLCFRWRGVEMG